MSEKSKPVGESRAGEKDIEENNLEGYWLFCTGVIIQGLSNLLKPRHHFMTATHKTCNLS